MSDTCNSGKAAPLFSFAERVAISPHLSLLPDGCISQSHNTMVSRTTPESPVKPETAEVTPLPRHMCAKTSSAVSGPTSPSQHIYIAETRLSTNTISTLLGLRVLSRGFYQLSNETSDSEDGNGAPLARVTGGFRKRRPRLLRILLVVFPILLATMLYGLKVMVFTVPVVDKTESEVAQLQALTSLPWSVLVRHEDAIARLSPESFSHCALYCLDCRTTMVHPPLLPAWTLHVVNPHCASCTDVGTYAEAFSCGSGITKSGILEQPQELPQQKVHRAAVFASAAAPLGRIGAMLLAISSVTNTVPLAEEMPCWEWMQFTSSGSHVSGRDNAASEFRDAGSARSPYLAVMGIPSTDQPGRASLREAQRRTWLGYSEVARVSNHFRGALLALYLFAGVERMQPTETKWKKGNASHMKSFPDFNLKRLLLTRDEFVKVSAARFVAEDAAAVTENGERAVPRVPAYAIPRVRLRDDWQTTNEYDSPCADVVRVNVDGGTLSAVATVDPLAYLGSVLELPVIPAAVAPAEYICHASAALWKEALTHRNVVWVDMMTDRRPTTDKKLGENKKWGLPVEVGMSQKLILWLEYAYHAFPNVPYIIKGDDDSYLKVPQFLNDVRYVLSEKGKTELSRGEVRLMPRDTPISVNKSMCTYWGSTRSVRGTRFNAGMSFMVHRHIVQAVLEPPGTRADNPHARLVGRYSNSEYVRLSVHDFYDSLDATYRRMQFDHEDVMLGFLIRDRLAREQELCWNNKVFYVKETLTRFHDLRVGRAGAVTWASVVVHRCSATDLHFLHFYFTHEHNMPVPVNATLEAEESAACQVAAAWVAEQKAHQPQLTTWFNMPSVKWVSRRNGPVAPARVIDPQDSVAVYMHKYKYFRQPEFQVYDGYVSYP